MRINGPNPVRTPPAGPRNRAISFGYFSFSEKKSNEALQDIGQS